MRRRSWIFSRRGPADRNTTHSAMCKTSTCHCVIKLLNLKSMRERENHDATLQTGLWRNQAGDRYGATLAHCRDRPCMIGNQIWSQRHGRIFWPCKRQDLTRSCSATKTTDRMNLKWTPHSTATMAFIIGQLRPQITVPFGVNVLWDPMSSIALGGRDRGPPLCVKFSRGTYASDMGPWTPDAGKAMRYRDRLGRSDMAMLYNVCAEFADSLDRRPLSDRARSAVFSSIPDDGSGVWPDHRGGRGPIGS